MLELDLIKSKLETRISKDLTQASFFIQELFKVCKVSRNSIFQVPKKGASVSYFIVPTQILRGRI